jgi:adenylylsulfate kinase
MNTESILWLYGPPGSGKTTLGHALSARLRGRGAAVSLLDEDELRGGLGADLSHSLEDQAELERRTAQMALLLAEQGTVVIVAATTGRLTQRIRLRRALASAPLRVVALTTAGKPLNKKPKTLSAAEQLAAQHFEASASDPTLNTTETNETKCVDALMGLLETGTLVVSKDALPVEKAGFRQNWRLRERDQRAELLAEADQEQDLPGATAGRARTVAERMYGKDALDMPWYEKLPTNQWSTQGVATLVISAAAILGLVLYAGTLLVTKKPAVDQAQEVQKKAVDGAPSGPIAKTKETTGKLLQDLVQPSDVAALERAGLTNSGSATKEPLRASRAAEEVRKATLDEVNAVMSAYASAKTWQEKLPCIYDADRLRSRIQSYYEKAEGEDQPCRPVTAVHETQSLQHRLLEGLVPATGGKPAVSYWLRQSPDGKLRLDWEAHVGAGDMSWPDLAKQRPVTATLMRCTAILSDYYNYEFASRERYLCWKLTSPNGQHSVYAYAERSGALAFSSTLYSPAVAQPMTVRVAFPEKAQSGECALLTEILEPSWALPMK